MYVSIYNADSSLVVSTRKSAAQLSASGFLARHAWTRVGKCLVARLRSLSGQSIGGRVVISAAAVDHSQCALS